jgi:hypothetical protein
VRLRPMLRLHKCTRAIVTIELALLIPIMWMMLAGAFDIVNLIYTIFEVNNAAALTASAISEMPSTQYTAANITGLLESVNRLSAPINVTGPVTSIGAGQGTIIVSVVVQGATANVVPQLEWQCAATSLKQPAVSHVGILPGHNQTVNATLPPPPNITFPAIAMLPSDSAVIAETFYLYSPFIFGSGLLGLGVFQLYDEAIFRFRLGNSTIPTYVPTQNALGFSNVITVTGTTATPVFKGSC